MRQPQLEDNGEPLIELISFSPADFQEVRNIPVTDIINAFRPGNVNWINLDGAHPMAVYEALGERFGLHSLLIEDITTEVQPKAEEYEGYLFFTLKMVHQITDTKVEYEQISFVLGDNYLLSFQEKAGDFFGTLRDKVRTDQGKIRRMSSDYLLYRLIDIIIEKYYTVLEGIGQQIEDIEEDILQNPSNNEFRKIQRTKKELIFLRKALYPLREAIGRLTRSETIGVSREGARYFADLYDHVVQLISSLDTYRDLTTSLMDIHINALNTRMNEVMKVLAIISTIFMPLTFVVGVYGMNFDVMPELRWPYGYLYVLTLMAIITGGMVAFFRHKKWF